MSFFETCECHLLPKTPSLTNKFALTFIHWSLCYSRSVDTCELLDLHPVIDFVPFMELPPGLCLQRRLLQPSPGKLNHFWTTHLQCGVHLETCPCRQSNILINCCLFPGLGRVICTTSSPLEGTSAPGIQSVVQQLIAVGLVVLVPYGIRVDFNYIVCFNLLNKIY